MSEHVFHFTDSARLPWILFNQELRVSLDTQGGQSLLWATTKDPLDRTSACASKAARERFRTGATRLIRFTLRAEDFERWPDILARFPQYTEETRIYTEAEARRLGETDFAAWRCRADSLPLSKIVRVEWRSYGGGSTWHTLDIGPKCLLMYPEVALNEMGNPIDLGCMLGGKKFYYRQGTWHGQVSYAVGARVR